MKIEMLGWRWRNLYPFALQFRRVVSQQCTCCPGSPDCEKLWTRVVVFGPLIVHILHRA